MTWLDFGGQKLKVKVTARRRWGVENYLVDAIDFNLCSSNPNPNKMFRVNVTCL